MWRWEDTHLPQGANTSSASARERPLEARERCGCLGPWEFSADTQEGREGVRRLGSQAARSVWVFLSGLDSKNL